ncbi:MAG: VWA domain-containing protein [Acidobacteriota bacterium]|nr:VWA domain-containing protein [Acidobacteriota bacterium]
MKLFIGFVIAAALFIAAFTLTPGAGAQSRQQQQPRQSPSPQPTATPQEVGEDDVIRVNTELVTLTATVTDARGRYRADLKRSDFTVYEDGVPQQLAYFNTGDRVPVSLGLIFDTSGIMVDKIEGVEDAVTHFVKSVAIGDEIFLIRFSDDAEIVQDFTDDRRRILRAVEHLEPRGSTALYDAVFLGLQRVATGKHRKRALLLLTDGNDTASNVNFKTALELARKSEVIIYALGIGHGERGSFGHPGSSDHDVLGSIFAGAAGA